MEEHQVVFTFDDMITSLREAITSFPDKRNGKNTHYTLMDAASGAFSVFFTQCPSFLAYQKLLEERYTLSNAQSLFGMHTIPSDNQIRNLLDPVSPPYLDAVFEKCFDALKISGHLDSFRVPLGKARNDLLIALDGTEYHSSEDISCTNCSTRVKDGETRYLHGMITPTLVRGGNNRIISLPPEFITPQDGTLKQDCEQNAAKRWIKKHGKQYSRENATILGDAMYCHEPMCREFLEAGLNFILVCKPESHKTTYEWIRGITKEKVIDHFDGKKHTLSTYHYAEGIPLADSENPLLVNFVEIRVVDRKSGKQLYHNAFVTNHPITDKTLETIVEAGRARWKIENENNNTLKTKGYHLEHNFGHGKENLSSLLATMNLLAFLFHTMLEFMNKKYKLLREKTGRRDTLFNDMRALLKHISFRSFESLMDFMLEKPHDERTLKIPV